MMRDSSQAELLQQGARYLFYECVCVQTYTPPNGRAVSTAREAEPSRVNPIYYVFFTTATIIASAILFQGFNTTDAANTLSLICGFLIIFMGVYLLNISRQPEAPHHANSLEAGLMSKFMSSLGNLTQPDEGGILVGRPERASDSGPCEGESSYIDPRMSMSGRLSTDPNPSGTMWNYGPLPTSEAALYSSDAPGRPQHGRKSSLYRQQNSTLFSAFEEVDEQDGQNGPGTSQRKRAKDDVAMDDFEIGGDDSDGEEGASRPLRASASASRGPSASGTREGRSLVGRTGRENGNGFDYMNEDLSRPESAQPGIGYGAGGAHVEREAMSIV